MLLKLKSIGVKIKSVANNQANVINAVKKNLKKISDFKRKTARQFSEVTDLVVDKKWYMKREYCMFILAGYYRLRLAGYYLLKIAGHSVLIIAGYSLNINAEYCILILSG